MNLRITAPEARQRLEIARKGDGIDAGLNQCYDAIRQACLNRKGEIRIDPEFQARHLFSARDMQTIVEFLRADGYIITQDASVITVSWERAV